jgi:hypothetical protein
VLELGHEGRTRRSVDVMTQISSKEQVLVILREKLPPIFSRKHVEELTGGVITAVSLAGLDKNGNGPKAFKIGGRVGYERDSFLEWLEQKVKPRGKQKQPGWLICPKGK